MISIHYQTSRNQIDVDHYYPEDGKTPRQRVDFIKGLKDENKVDHSFATACPYIMEGVECILANRNQKDIKYYIDNQEVECDAIYKLLAEPMKELTYYNEIR